MRAGKILGEAARRSLAVWVVSAVLLASCTGATVASTSPAPPPSTTVPVTATVATTTLPPTTTSSTPTTTSSVPETTTTVPPTTTTMPVWWREPTVEEPLRVWVIGDSLAGPVGSALAALAREDGRFRVSVHGEGGTGLVSPAFFDWPAFVSAGIAAAAPEAVVVILGANDGQAMASGGAPVEFASAEWDARYRDLVGGFMDQLLEDAARVYWVEVPIMEGPNYDARMRHVSALLRWEASLRLTVRFVAAYDLFQAPGGGFAFELAGADGAPVTVRAPDGIHYTAAGAAMMAGRLLAILEEDWTAPGG